jgi:hypothetical protein
VKNFATAPSFESGSRVKEGKRVHRAMADVLHDRDTKFCTEFRKTLAAGGVKCLRLPPRSPNLNAFAERWVRSVKEECLSSGILSPVIGNAGLVAPKSNSQPSATTPDVIASVPHST